jgi:hypothetical protein
MRLSATPTHTNPSDPLQERSLRRALTQFQAHDHAERNHPGNNNVPRLPPLLRLSRSATWRPLSTTPERLTPVVMVISPGEVRQLGETGSRMLSLHLPHCGRSVPQQLPNFEP